MQLSLFSNGLVDLDWMEGDDFQKIGQMFDQILIDYCNPETRIGGICLRICGNERQCFLKFLLCYLVNEENPMQDNSK